MIYICLYPVHYFHLFWLPIMHHFFANPIKQHLVISRQRKGKKLKHWQLFFWALILKMTFKTTYCANQWWWLWNIKTLIANYDNLMENCIYQILPKYPQQMWFSSPARLKECIGRIEKESYFWVRVPLRVELASETILCHIFW